MGVAREGVTPPPKPKNCCRKMMLFPKALFVVTNFPKIIIIIQFFYSIFIKNFQIFSKFSNNLCFSSKKREKLTHALLNFFDQYAKIMHF